MSATTTHTPQLDQLRTVLEAHPAHPMCQTIAATLEAPAVGTMREWMQAHDGQTVTTVQVTRAGVWSPTGRTIDAHTRAGAVILNGSTREYKGMRVHAATPSCLIVTGDREAIAYTIESETTK